MDEELDQQQDSAEVPEEEPTSEEGEGEAPAGPGPSLYNFDLMSAEGVTRIVALLPILDEDIVKALYQEVFPGYPLDNIAPRVARIELRGFFMDFLGDEAA